MPEEIKTDEIFRVWVDSNGKITSFSDFNNDRYKNISFPKSDIKKANDRIIDRVDKTYDKYQVFDKYVSTDKEGNLIL